MGASPIQVDDTTWPIVVITYTGSWSDEVFARHLQQLMGYLPRRTPFGFISDIDKGTPPPATQRRMIASMFEEYEEGLRAYCRGWAQVTTSAMTRGIITAVNWLKPSPVPSRTFATVDEAKRWLNGMLT